MDKKKPKPEQYNILRNANDEPIERPDPLPKPEPPKPMSVPQPPPTPTKDGDKNG